MMMGKAHQRHARGVDFGGAFKRELVGTEDAMARCLQRVSFEAVVRAVPG